MYNNDVLNNQASSDRSTFRMKKDKGKGVKDEKKLSSLYAKDFKRYAFKTGLHSAEQRTDQKQGN